MLDNYLYLKNLNIEYRITCIIKNNDIYPTDNNYLVFVFYINNDKE